jgi:putative ABC transport system permease protein
MISYYLKVISENFKSRKIRMILTALGIIIGVSLIIILISLGQGMENGIEEQFKKIGIKSIRVVPGELNGPPAAGIGFDKDLQAHIEDVRGVEYVNPVVINDDILVFNDIGALASIIGYDTTLSDKGFVDTDIKLDSGRYFRSDEKDSILIGYNVANNLFDDKIKNRNSVSILNKEFKVIGIFEKTGSDVDDDVYIPLETAREIFNNKNEVNVFVIQIKDGTNIEEVAADIQKKLTRELKTADEFQVFTPQQLINRIKSILGIVTLVLIGIAAISIFVGAIGIMNSMYTSVLERTREIGVMKAVGAKRGDILTLFLLEASIIGIIGGLIGVILGVSISYGAGAIISALGFVLITIKVEFNLVLFSLIFSIIIGMISGILPAIKASKMQAIDALRYE